MLSYEFYKVAHLLGVFLVILSFGGVILHTVNGGTRAHPGRKIASITHGIGLLLIFIAGFGLLARLGILWPWPTWVAAKATIWLLFGGLLPLAYRKGSIARILWWLVPFIGMTAAAFAIYKP